MINRDTIADAVSAKLNIGKAEARSVLAASIDEIVSQIKAGEQVKLASLGTFAVKDTAARSGKNPITGAPMNIAAGRKVTFKVAADLKRVI